MDKVKIVMLTLCDFDGYTDVSLFCREYEHWLALIEQTVDSLNTEFTSKMSQIKLLLQHLKGSMESGTDSSLNDQSATSQLTHSQTANHIGKRPGASSSSTPTPAKRARK